MSGTAQRVFGLAAGGGAVEGPPVSWDEALALPIFLGGPGFAVPGFDTDLDAQGLLAQLLARYPFLGDVDPGWDLEILEDRWDAPTRTIVARQVIDDVPVYQSRLHFIFTVHGEFLAFSGRFVSDPDLCSMDRTETCDDFVGTLDDRDETIVDCEPFWYLPDREIRAPGWATAGLDDGQVLLPVLRVTSLSEDGESRTSWFSDTDAAFHHPRWYDSPGHRKVQKYYCSPWDPACWFADWRDVFEDDECQWGSYCSDPDFQYEPRIPGILFNVDTDEHMAGQVFTKVFELFQRDQWVDPVLGAQTHFNGVTLSGSYSFYQVGRVFYRLVADYLSGVDPTLPWTNFGHAYILALQDAYLHGELPHSGFSKGEAALRAVGFPGPAWDIPGHPGTTRKQAALQGPSGMLLLFFVGDDEGIYSMNRRSDGWHGPTRVGGDSARTPYGLDAYWGVDGVGRVVFADMNHVVRYIEIFPSGLVDGSQVHSFPCYLHSFGTPSGVFDGDNEYLFTLTYSTGTTNGVEMLQYGDVLYLFENNQYRMFWLYN